MKRVLSILVMIIILVFSYNSVISSNAESGSVKKACAAALEATGNVDKIQYKSASATDFDAISYKHNKKISSCFMVMSDNTVYTICVAKVKNTKNDNKVYKAFKKYKANKINSDYFKSDYSKKEREVIKNAVYGKKGKYVWYVSMGSKSEDNKGVAALKKVLFD